jgi:hypothetical protein
MKLNDNIRATRMNAIRNEFRQYFERQRRLRDVQDDTGQPASHQAEILEQIQMHQDRRSINEGNPDANLPVAVPDEPLPDPNLVAPDSPDTIYDHNFDK